MERDVQILPVDDIRQSEKDRADERFAAAITAAGHIGNGYALHHATFSSGSMRLCNACQAGGQIDGDRRR
jgi:hypothetical protein